MPLLVVFGRLWGANWSRLVLQRDVDPWIGLVCGHGLVHEPHRGLVDLDDVLQRGLAEVVPPPVGVDLVADDPAADASHFALVAVALGEDVDHRS